MPADGGDAPAFQFKCPGCAARLVAMHNEGPPNSNEVRLQCFVCSGYWDPAHLLREELDRRAAQGDPIWPTPPDLVPWEPPRHPSQDLTGQEFLERIRPPAPPEPPDFSSWRVSFCPPMSSPPSSSLLGDLWPGLDLDPIPTMVDAAGAVTDVAEAATSIATSMEQLVSLVSLVILIHARTPGPTPPEGSTSEVAESPPDVTTEVATGEPPPMTSVASTASRAPVDAPSEAPAPELTPTEKDIVHGMFLLGAFGPDHPETKDKIARRSGAGGGIGENIKKLMASLKGKGVVESSGPGRGPKSGYWLTELGRNMGEALARPKR